MEQFTMRAARNQRNMTQAEIAEKMGVTPAQISSWERGKSDMTTVQLVKFCEIVGMQYADIFLPIAMR